MAKKKKTNLWPRLVSDSLEKAAYAKANSEGVSTKTRRSTKMSPSGGSRQSSPYFRKKTKKTKRQKKIDPEKRPETFLTITTSLL